MLATDNEKKRALWELLKVMNLKKRRKNNG